MCLKFRLEEVEVMFFADECDFIRTFVDRCDDKVLLHAADCKFVMIAETEDSPRLCAGGW